MICHVMIPITCNLVFRLAGGLMSEYVGGVGYGFTESAPLEAMLSAVCHIGIKAVHSVTGHRPLELTGTSCIKNPTIENDVKLYLQVLG